MDSKVCNQQFFLQLQNWRGPKDTVFDGGVFPARLTFPPDYPLSPPKMRFTCELFHPNSKYISSFWSNRHKTNNTNIICMHTHTQGSNALNRPWKCLHFFCFQRLKVACLRALLKCCFQRSIINYLGVYASCDIDMHLVL